MACLNFGYLRGYRYLRGYLPVPLSASPPPILCKDGGWQSLVRSDGSTFKNQGDCIQYVNTGK